MIITIDPGHTDGVNKGAVRGYAEGTQMYLLAQLLKEALELYDGVTCVVTRTLTENPSLARRGGIAIENGSEVFLSLHSNASSSAPNAAYVVGFYSVKRPESKAFCDLLAKTVTQTMEDAGAWMNYSRVKTIKDDDATDYYGVIRSSVSTGNVKYSFILEHGFHSNEAQCLWLYSKDNLSVLANAEAQAFAEYFGLKKKISEQQPEASGMRIAIPQGADLNKYVGEGKYFFGGGECKNAVPDFDGSAFLLNIEAGVTKDIPYAVQNVHYFGKNINYRRSGYTSSGAFTEIIHQWKKTEV